MSKGNKTFKDHKGKRFGRLIAIMVLPGSVQNGNSTGKVWICRCDCGKKVRVKAKSLTQGITRSCGCLSRDTSRKLFTTHGMTGTKEHRAWKSMRDRCLNPRCRGYRDYGERGIKICKRWDSFENFFTDMGPLPAPRYTIERKNNEGDYCPENCVWVPRGEQNKNTRACVRLTYQGKTMILSDWAKHLGIPYPTIKSRYQSGWSVEQMLGTPILRRQS